jgi:hypothetical protein
MMKLNPRCRMKFVDVSIDLFALGSVAIGTWGLVHPRSLTALLGDDPELGRFLGARDLAVGVALLKMTGPLPLAMRMASDLHDAVRLRERSPVVALGAAVFALWGAAALCSNLLGVRDEELSAEKLQRGMS